MSSVSLFAIVPPRIAASVQDASAAVQSAAADTIDSAATAYDSIWTNSGMPTQSAEGLERVMLSDDKIFVVLAVVLIIWIGIATLLIRNDRRLRELERRVEEHISDNDLL